MRGPRRLFLATLPIVAGVLLACGGAETGGIGDVPADEEDAEADPGSADGESADGEAAGDAARPDAGDDGSGDGGHDGGSAAGSGSASSDSRELTIATADAADRTGVATDDIELVELSMVTWPDGALGCPEPGTMYTQALVEGYRIVLDADGTTLVYHGALGSDPFLCESPQEPVNPVS